MSAVLVLIGVLIIIGVVVIVYLNSKKIDTPPPPLLPSSLKFPDIRKNMQTRFPLQKTRVVKLVDSTVPTLPTTYNLPKPYLPTPCACELDPDATIVLEKLREPLKAFTVWFNKVNNAIVWGSDGDFNTSIKMLIDGIERESTRGMLQTVNDQGRLERMLFGLKIATVVVRYGNTTLMPNTVKWLNNVINDAIPVYLPRDNNLKAWCILTIAITGLAINNDNLVQTAVTEWYDVCDNHILDSGEMPAEKKRATRSEKYHEYACEPMVMSAYWTQQDHPRLHALVNYVLTLDREVLSKQMSWLVLYNQQFGLSRLSEPSKTRAIKELEILKQDPMYICSMGGNIYWQI